MAIPFAAPIDFEMPALLPNQNEGFWYLFQANNEFILITSDGKHVPATPPPLKRSLYIGMLGGKHLFAGEVEDTNQAPSGYTWTSLRSLFGIISDEHFAIAGRAMQLIAWDRVNKHCGCCGNLTIRREKEHCRQCTSCSYLTFPKQAPAILALVKKENKILLGRGPNFPEKFFSLIAGFVDPGETLEQCVAREVFEETRIIVKNVRYFGSQPWPFSHSLMIGFTCEWESGDISVDLNELAEAAWFDNHNLPQLPPILSLSRIMIDAHVQRSS